MVTSRAFCANTGVRLIDLPRTEPTNDPQASLRATVQWHFGLDTGSRYWLDRAKTLEFHPLIDVKIFEDLLDDPVNEPTRPMCRAAVDPSTFWRPRSGTTPSVSTTKASSATKSRPPDLFTTKLYLPSTPMKDMP
jgi:hypothetical protein